MRNTIEKLFAAQKTLLQHPAASPEHQALLRDLQTAVSAPVLAHYLRLLAQGRKAVAEVRHGVCSECHLRLPSGLPAALVAPTDLHLCENCGCYLRLPEDERLHLTARAMPTVKAVRRNRKIPAQAAA